MGIKRGGTHEFIVKVSDNLGLFTFSDTITINVAASATHPQVNFDMGTDELELFLGSTIELKATASHSDKVEFFFFFDTLGEIATEPSSMEWTPAENGLQKLRVVATNTTNGLQDEDVLMVNVSEQLALKDLWIVPGQIEPEFQQDVLIYEANLLATTNNIPSIDYETILGTTASVTHPEGIDQRVWVNESDRTAIVRVEEEGNPGNFLEYSIVFSLNTGAPVKVDTILYENFGNEDSGFSGLASEYTKFSSAAVADFIDDSVSINEWWQVSPTDQGASGEAKFWATNLSDEGDTLTFTNIDVSAYSQITSVAFWSFANTGWSGYSTKAPFLEIAVDDGAYEKLYKPANIDPSQFNAQSQWGYFSLPLNLPLSGSEMNFRIGTYDNQQWMIDDILLLSESNDACYHTLQSLEVAGYSINYDPDELLYEVEVDNQQVPVVTHATTSAEAISTMDAAVSVNQQTNTVEERTTSVTVENWCGSTTYQILFTTSDIVGIENYSLPKLNIYPNPASERIFVNHNESFSQVQIFDATGNLVKEIDAMNRFELNINIDAFPAGLYIVKTSKNDESNGIGRFTK